MIINQITMTSGNSWLIEEVSDLTELDLDNVKEFTQVNFGVNPRLDNLAKIIYLQPGRWFRLNEPIYIAKRHKLLDQLYSRLNKLNSNNAILKLEWCIHQPSTYLLPVDFYLYAFRILLYDESGALYPGQLL